MVKNTYIAVFICIIFSLSFVESAHGGALKWVKIGKYQDKVYDYGDQGCAQGEGTFGYYYYNGFTSTVQVHRGFLLGTPDWTDENGNYWPFKQCGAAHGGADEVFNTIPVPDAEGISIRRYRRDNPPTITVDGFRVDEPWPLVADEVNPDAIPGTADILVESWCNTSMGLTIHQKTLNWSQTHHDDYIIYDWTFINTGNVDADDDVELPNQTLEDVYFLRAMNSRTGSRCWNSCYGEYPTDSMRIMYAYPARRRGSATDNFGDPRSNGWLRRPWYIGEATIHADKSVNDHSDDPSQPQMTGTETAELLWLKRHAEANSPSDYALLYQTMQLGFGPFDGTPEMVGTYPGTHHSLRMDEQGYEYPSNVPWWTWRACSYNSHGPYTFAPGDSIRIVFATVMGCIKPETAWEVGRAWQNGTATWDGPDNLPPPFQAYPDLAPTYNDWAKDCWVATGKDSLFTNAWNAQWNVRQNYNVPIPPPAPSVEVTSIPDFISIEWGNESESASDFAGYRLYRAVGTADSTYSLIFECGDGTANPLTHSFEDMSAERGVAYFYYVAAFDDGIENEPGVTGERESLESGKYLNRTTVAAYLSRPPSEELTEIRVVPNPFNIGAAKLQYPGEPDKIMFLNLPPICTIKIYNETGDLIKTLEHTDGSGDETWGRLIEEHSTTESDQLAVSGLYIAHIETPDGMSINVKFLIVR